MALSSHLKYTGISSFFFLYKKNTIEKCCLSLRISQPNDPRCRSQPSAPLLVGERSEATETHGPVSAGTHPQGPGHCSSHCWGRRQPSWPQSEALARLGAAGHVPRVRHTESSGWVCRLAVGPGKFLAPVSSVTPLASWSFGERYMRCFSGTKQHGLWPSGPILRVETAAGIQLASSFCDIGMSSPCFCSHGQLSCPRGS